ncbi:hypothetical protein A4X13_0g9480, partial [Tilletia indica]
VRCINTRRTTGMAELLRRGGETTASDFTMKAKLVREEEEDDIKTKDRSGGNKVRHPQGQLALVLQDNAAGRETDNFTGHHPAWVKVVRRRLWRARCSFSPGPEFKKTATGNWQAQHHKVERDHNYTTDKGGTSWLRTTRTARKVGGDWELKTHSLGRGGKTTVCGASETAEPLSQDQKAVCSGQR